ncbi:hypothetical protein [Cryptosporangium aurantiacum]|uniref:Recombinase n=1 Tax=Cryptosporangium aurantiacum TaxID=134849 RepID=A0A1M7R2Q2_9ACTN|nr:hypothetical protein [Cryptosporangium aurantiacum]SHN39319.1 hypothetical protein SAMN05443668_106250 [Cryptosporangium aurantiacum]
MSGRRAGRKRSCPDEVVRKVVELHRSGLRPQAISDAMNAGGYLTPSGKGRWSRSTAYQLLGTWAARDLLNGDEGTA